MKLSSITKPVSLTFLIAILSACSTSEGPAPIGKSSSDTKDGTQLTSLTPAQIELYQTGIKGLIPSSANADFVSVKTLKFSSEPGLHICGYARYQLSGAKKRNPVLCRDERRRGTADPASRPVGE